MTTMNVMTTDLADFGHREKMMAAELLQNSGNLPDDFANDGVTIGFNRMSDYVFLTNAEFDVAIMEDGELVSFYNSPYEGHEGTFKELLEMFDRDTWVGEDIDWFEDLADRYNNQI
jgi:hypothetical protein